MRKIALLVAPLLALSACSDREGAADPKAEAAAEDAGLSLDGPMLATPGLWRTTTSANGAKAFGANRSCVDAASQKDDHLISAPADMGCTPPERRPSAGGYAYQLTCVQDGLKTAISGKVTGNAKRVTITSTTHMTGPDGSQAMPPTTIVVDSIYVGPCPAGMKPGDSVQEGIG